MCGFCQGNFRKCVVFADAKIGLKKRRVDTFYGILDYFTHTLMILCLKIIIFSKNLNFFHKMCEISQKFGACSAKICVNHKNFRKPRADSARTPLLRAFGPQKWEHLPPASRKKNLGDETEKSPRTGF